VMGKRGEIRTNPDYGHSELNEMARVGMTDGPIDIVASNRIIAFNHSDQSE
jgi:hypothetical protein